MAIAYGVTKSINRAKGGNAVAAAAYRNRINYTDPTTDNKHYYANYEKDVPSYGFAIGERGELIEDKSKIMEMWVKAEKAEKKSNATVAREMVYALPKEFNKKQCTEVAKQMCYYISQQHELFVNGAIHFKEGNPHLHIQFSTRKIVKGEFKEKAREWDIKKTSSTIIKDIRNRWQELCNNYLSMDNWIDMRSYKTQRLDKKSQIHIGIFRSKDSLEYAEKLNHLASEYNQSQEEFENTAREWLAINAEIEKHKINMPSVDQYRKFQEHQNPNPILENPFSLASDTLKTKNRNISLGP